MTTQLTARARAAAFCEAYGLQIPVLMAPMAGACPPALAAAVGNAGGMGACGVLLMTPDKIADWVAQYRRNSNGTLQLNTWIPDPAPSRDTAAEADVRAFLAQWGPEVPSEAGDAPLIDFAAQCQAMLSAGPQVVSSIMGLYPPEFVGELQAQGIRWFATVTTVAEAIEAERAGADVIVAQGMEAGGHRGTFEADSAATNLVGLMALLPAVVDAVRTPVVATGGIGDARGIAAAMILGASAVQIGTGLLRTPEAAIPPAWADAIGAATPEGTVPTRAFSGRLGRAIRSRYVEAANGSASPDPAPYPVQRSLTQAMRTEAAQTGDIDRMQAWAGQAAGLATTEPAGELVTRLWLGAEALLAG